VRYRRLGSSNLDVSEISLGSWLTFGGGISNAQAKACVAKAFEVGINFIDTANVYSGGGAEEFLGEVLAERPRD
jgi:aryl-alcohol dehydrogenase-like predicted oxidoreductase